MNRTNFYNKGECCMSVIMEEKSNVITDLLIGTYSSLQKILTINYKIESPRTVEHSLHLNFGVLIGMTIDIKGKLILVGEKAVFNSIGESMFGIPLERDMLLSFSGELGNMIAGGLSTNLVESGIYTDITSPIVIQGNTTLTGYQQAHRITVVFENIGKLDVYLLLD